MDTKWIGRSKTIWGAVITFATAVLPALGAVLGWEISAGDIAGLGEAGAKAIDGFGSLIGIVLVVWGRLSAKTALTAS